MIVECRPQPNPPLLQSLTLIDDPLFCYVNIITYLRFLVKTYRAKRIGALVSVGTRLRLRPEPRRFDAFRMPAGRPPQGTARDNYASQSDLSGLPALPARTQNALTAPFTTSTEEARQMACDTPIDRLGSRFPWVSMSDSGAP